jgi:hypothetical protein
VNLNLPLINLCEWIVEKGRDFTARVPLLMTIKGLLRASAPDSASQLMKGVLDGAQRAGWAADRIARFLVLAPDGRTTWNTANRLGREVEEAYWRACDPNFWLRDNEADFDFALRRLVAAGRPRSALLLCHFDLAKADPVLLANMLEGMLRGEEPDGPLLESYHVAQALDRLESSGSLERDRLIRLGFGLIPALGYEAEHHATSLYTALMSDPKLFTELICLLYLPANQKRRDPVGKAAEVTAQIAWRVLHGCRQQPGTQTDGRIDPEQFVRFVDEARHLCREADRLGSCDSTLGQILAHAPPDRDGVWPFEPARDVLDRPEVEQMREGFAVGTMNKRGVTTRAYDEGGGQERQLAVTYRGHARALHNSHVHVAATLEQIASYYENDGLREDLRARLRREGH